MATRQFHIGAIVSAATGILMPTPGYSHPIAAVYEILNFMTGDSLFTHQLPRVGREVQPYLLEQHPFLRDVCNEDIAGDKCTAALKALVEAHGEFLPVRPMHPEDHEVIDPIAELVHMNPTAQVIVINADDEGEVQS